MNKLIILIAIILAFSTASALEPIKVAIVNTSAGAVNVQVRLTDYSGGSATNIFTGQTASYTPNGSGIIIVDVSGSATAGTNWDMITASSVNSSYILDVYVNGSLFAQYRLDGLILSQSQASVYDIDGNITPPNEGSADLGNDGNRWGEVFVEQNTVHIGPVDGYANNTELALSYDTVTNTAHFTVDATDALLATSAGVTIPGSLTLNNLTGVGTRNIAVDATGQVVLGSNSVITNSPLTGDGTSGNPLGIADDGVTSTKIQDGTIVNADVSPTAAIAYSKLALTNNIQNSDLVPNAITTSKVANGTVTTSKMADSAVSGLKLLTYAVTNRHLAQNSVTADKFDPSGITNGHVLTYNGTNVTWAAPSASSSVIHNATLTGNGTSGSPLGINLGNSNTWSANQTFAGTFLITSNSRIAMTNSDNNARDIRFQEPSGTGTQYIGWRAPSLSFNGNYVFPATVGTPGQVLTIATSNNGSGTDFKDSATTIWTTPTFTLADDAVTSAKIQDGAIVNADVSPSAAIAYSKLALTNSILNSDITANAITTSKVANGTVTTSKMADSAVSGLKLLTFAVTNRHLSNGAVTPSKIDGTGAGTGNVLTYNGSNVTWAAPTTTAKFAYQSVSSNSTLSSTVEIVGANSSGGTFTITLPAANSVPAGKFIIINIEAGSDNVTVSRNGTDLIDGAATRTLNGGLLQGLIFYSNGVSSWHAI